MKEKTILVTNDDSIYSGGIDTLVRVASQFGKVVVIAPDKPQSAKSNAITINQPLRLKKVSRFKDLANVEAYACSGTPVDCVKLGMDKIVPDADLCLSGINHGSNASTNVLYSGTMAAAMEGAMHGALSVGFSLMNFDEQADMTTAGHVVKLVVEQMITKGMSGHQLINVNIPDLPIADLKGMKICRQADAKWVEAYDERTDPYDRKYYWLLGEFVNKDEGEDTDIYALDRGFVSIVPVKYDLTAHSELGFLKEKWTF